MSAGEVAETSFDVRLKRLELTLFDTIYAPGARGDPVSLLSLHAACRDAYGEFSSLEIGSHLGASLQSFVADPRCTTITSIDPRPLTQPDERYGTWEYPDNSTERMVARLRHVPGADLAKLTTLEARSEDLTPSDIAHAPQLCFIDGEHTNKAALHDAQFCRRLVRDYGAIAFHDRSTVWRAIAEFLTDLERDQVRYRAYALPTQYFVIELGQSSLSSTRYIRRRQPAAARAPWTIASRLPRPSGAVGMLLRIEASVRLTWASARVRRLRTRMGRLRDTLARRSR